MPGIKNATSKLAISKKATSKKRNNSYLTKRIVTSAARISITQAASETMRIIGYNVIVRRGWLVKKFIDGRIEKISPIHPINREGAIILD